MNCWPVVAMLMGIEIVIILQTMLAHNIESYYVEYYMVVLASRRLVRPELVFGLYAEDSVTRRLVRPE